MKPHTGGAFSWGASAAPERTGSAATSAAARMSYGSFAAQPGMLQEIFGLSTHRRLVLTCVAFQCSMFRKRLNLETMG